MAERSAASPVSGPPARPGFWRHVLLLWELRAAIALNRRGRRGSALLAWILSSAPAVPLFLAGQTLLRAPPVAAFPDWSRFRMRVRIRNERSSDFA